MKIFSDVKKDWYTGDIVVAKIMGKKFKIYGFVHRFGREMVAENKSHFFDFNVLKNLSLQGRHAAAASARKLVRGPKGKFSPKYPMIKWKIEYGGLYTIDLINGKSDYKIPQEFGKIRKVRFLGAPLEFELILRLKGKPSISGQITIEKSL